jgi:RNA polymerase sigma-70 factor (ECF subfamily)
VTEADRDEDLVRRFLSGDAPAFGILVERHQTRVYNVALRVLGNAEDAHDATQDAFLSALRKLGSFRGDAAFTTWMHRVTVNACYDLLRKQRRQPLLRLASDEGGSPPETGPPVPDHAESSSGTIDAARALAEIPVEYRVALVLADVEDLPYDEISRVLDVPVGTVKSRVHRGRLALARAMGLEDAPTRYRREPSAATGPSEPES